MPMQLYWHYEIQHYPALPIRLGTQRFSTPEQLFTFLTNDLALTTSFKPVQQISFTQEVNKFQSLAMGMLL